MAGVIADVRGSLGGQVVCLLAWAAYAIEHGGHITGIRLNAHDCAPESKVDYLKDVFVGIPPVKTVEATAKISLNDPSLWGRIERTRAAWTKMLKPVPAGERDEHLHVLHVRTGDRHPVSVGAYERFARDHKKPLVMMGNDRAVLERLSQASGHPFVHGSAVEDWFTLRRARHVYGGWSYFTISAVLLDPTLRVSVFGKQDGPVPFHPANMKALRAITHTFPNVRVTA